LRIGWSDGPLPAVDWPERLDRWVRTVWPLYRFREFAREAVLDRLLGRPDPGPAPETFASRSDLFRHLYADRADAVDAAYRAFEQERTLAAYARYLGTASPGHLARGKERARSNEELTEETASVRAFDALVEELVAAGQPTLVLLMPENPILAEDVAGEFHRADVAARGAALVREITTRHGVRLVDARALLPSASFLDFDHPIIELDRFDALLASEITRSIGAPGGDGAAGG